jgi:hypothetical protein
MAIEHSLVANQTDLPQAHALGQCHNSFKNFSCRLAAPPDKRINVAVGRHRVKHLQVNDAGSA